MVLPGLTVGLLLAVGTSMSMRTMLVGVSPADPVAFGAVAGVTVLVVLLASIGPAR